MKNILRQLYNGEIDLDNETIPRDREYISTVNKIQKEQNYFKGILSSEDNTRMNQLDDLRNLSAMMNNYAHFTCGFKLAIQLMCECCGTEESPED